MFYLIRFFGGIFAIIACSTYGAISCQGSQNACDIQLVDNCLIEKSTRNVVAKNIVDQGILADVSLLKYGKQYALIRESLTNDKSTLVVPLRLVSGVWMYGSAYHFSTSLLNSSRKDGRRWFGLKSNFKPHAVDEGIWDFAYGETQKISRRDIHLSRWPAPWLRVLLSDTAQTEQCFVPFPGKNSSFPSEVVSCRRLAKLADGEAIDFSGIIGSSLTIQMRLRVSRDILEGEYQYLKYGKDIRVRGRIDQEGAIEIEEMDEDAKGVGAIFSGRLIDGVIKGEWKSTKNQARAPFFLMQQGFSE